MEDNITLKIEILKDALVKAVNNCGLDISVINYVVQDFAKAVSIEANNYLQEQIKQYNKKIEMSKNEKTDIEEKEEENKKE